MDAGSRAGSAHIAGPDNKRPALLRVAVTGSALAGAVALVMVTGPLRPEVHVAAGIAVLGSAVYYLARPRAGTIALLTVGTAVCVACVVAFLRVGAVPWLLTGFWAGAATILAGLLDLIGRDGKDAMVGVTVAAVLSLLLLSALGLGQYVRLSWPLAGRAMLEPIAEELSGTQAAAQGAETPSIEQASGGRWVERLVVRTRDRVGTWNALALAVQSDGWRVVSNQSCSRLRAVKDGYELDVVVTEPYGESTTDEQVPMQSMRLAVYVGAADR